MHYAPRREDRLLRACVVPGKSRESEKEKPVRRRAAPSLVVRKGAGAQAAAGPSRAARLGTLEPDFRWSVWWSPQPMRPNLTPDPAPSSTPLCSSCENK